MSDASYPKNDDYVTVVKVTQPCNKKFTLDAEGRIHKVPAKPLSDGTAVTIYVPDQESFTSMIKKIQSEENLLLILGYIPETVDLTRYRLLSKNKFKQYKGNDVAYTRTKDNFKQSSEPVINSV